MIGSGQEKFLREILPDNTGTDTLLVFDTPANTAALTINRTYATRDLPDSENEANPQPDFAITFGEDELLAGTPVVETLNLMANEAEEAVRKLVAAFLDPSNSLQRGDA